MEADRLVVQHPVGVIVVAALGQVVKRVVGLPGDHVVCCDVSGLLTVNGIAVVEPYLYPGDKPSDLTFDVTVPVERVWVMGDHRSDLVMVQSTIALAHSLERTVVAECVETQELLDMLRSLDCDVAQGFLIGRPTSAKGLLRRLQDERRRRVA